MTHASQAMPAALPGAPNEADMADLIEDMRAERDRIIRLLDLQLASRPGASEWRDGLHELERIVELQLAREDDLLLAERCGRVDQRPAADPCVRVARLRGTLPTLFNEARAAHPDTAFMGYLRLSATLRRWAGCLERGI